MKRRSRLSPFAMATAIAATAAGKSIYEGNMLMASRRRKPRRQAFSTRATTEKQKRKQQKRHESYLRCIANNPCLENGGLG